MHAVSLLTTRDQLDAIRETARAMHYGRALARQIASDYAGVIDAAMLERLTLSELRAKHGLCDALALHCLRHGGSSMPGRIMSTQEAWGALLLSTVTEIEPIRFDVIGRERVLFAAGHVSSIVLAITPPVVAARLPGALVPHKAAPTHHREPVMQFA